MWTKKGLKARNSPLIGLMLDTVSLYFALVRKSLSTGVRLRPSAPSIRLLRGLSSLFGSFGA